MDKDVQTRDDEDHSLAGLIRVYWGAYGGFSSLFSSFYFWLSLILAAVTANFWLHDAWWDQVLSVLPNLLGFTLGGFAIFLAFGDEKFREILCGEDPDEDGAASPYMEASATFLHFVLVQVVALLAAIIGKATAFFLPVPFGFISDFLHSWRWIGDLLGYWLFLYGICSAAAAALATFRVASWYDRHAGLSRRL